MAQLVHCAAGYFKPVMDGSCIHEATGFTDDENTATFLVSGLSHQKRLTTDNAQPLNARWGSTDSSHLPMHGELNQGIKQSNRSLFPPDTVYPLPFV